MRSEGDEEEVIRGIESLMNKLKEAEAELEEVDEKVDAISKETDEVVKIVDSIGFPGEDLISSYTPSTLDVIVEEPYTKAAVEEGVQPEVKALALRLLDLAEVKLEEGLTDEAGDFVKLVERLEVEEKSISERLQEVKGRILKRLLEEEGTSPGVITDLTTAGEILELRNRVKEKIETLREVLRSEKVEEELLRRLQEAEEAYSQGRYFRALHICEEIGSALQRKLEYTLEMRTQALLDRVQGYIEDLERETDVADPETVRRFRENLNSAVRHFLTHNLPQAYNLGQKLLMEARSVYLNRKTQNVTRALLQIKAEMEEFAKIPELKERVDEMRGLMAEIKRDLEKGTKEGIESAEKNLKKLFAVGEELRDKKKNIEKAEEYIRRTSIKMVGLPEEERTKYSKYLSSIKEELRSGKVKIAREAAEKLYERVSRHVERRLRSAIEGPYEEVVELLSIFETLFPENTQEYENIREELADLYAEGKHMKLKSRVEEVKVKLTEELPVKVRTKLNDILDATVTLRLLSWEIEGAGMGGDPGRIEKKENLIKRIEKKPLKSSVELARYFNEVEKDLKRLGKSSKEIKEICKEVSKHYLSSLYSMTHKWIKNPIFLYVMEFAVKRAVEFYKMGEYYLSFLLLRRVEDVFSTHVERGVLSKEEDGELESVAALLPVGGYREKLYREVLQRAKVAEKESRPLLRDYLKGVLLSAVKS